MVALQFIRVFLSSRETSACAPLKTRVCPILLWQPAPPRANRGGGLPLHQFLRLIAGGRMMDHGSASTNEDLISALRRGGVIER